MAAAIFDTHQFVRKLKASGFDERQAEALTEAIRASHESSEVATKHDLAEMKFELLKWVVGLSFAQIGLFIRIFMKFFLVLIPLYIYSTCTTKSSSLISVLNIRNWLRAACARCISTLRFTATTSAMRLSATSRRAALFCRAGRHRSPARIRRARRRRCLCLACRCSAFATVCKRWPRNSAVKSSMARAASSAIRMYIYTRARIGSAGSRKNRAMQIVKRLPYG